MSLFLHSHHVFCSVMSMVMSDGGGSGAPYPSMSEDDARCLEMDFQAALRLRGGADGVVALAPLIRVEEKSDPAPPDAPSVAAVCEKKSEPAGAPPAATAAAVVVEGKKDVPTAVDQVLLFFLLELYVSFYRLL